MDDSRGLLGALIFLGLVAGANFLMVAIVRGALRQDSRGFWESLGRTLKNPLRRQDDSMDELRRRMQELETGRTQARDDPDD